MSGGVELGRRPANPVATSGIGATDGHQCGPNEWQFTGLTKREAFAMAAMQGIRASMTNGHCNYRQVAMMAVDQADYLLDRLAEATP